jgi:trimethylamine-N-oxide reductase (cytochrome c)
MIEAFRSPKIELIVTIHPWLENDALFSDIVLPAQTIFEHEDIITWGRADTKGIAYQERVVNPVGESKSDYEIHQLLAQRLGVGEAFPPYETFLKRAYEASYAATKLGISWEEFKKRKLIIYDHPTPEEWEEIKRIAAKSNVKPGFTGFYESPEGKGVETPSGKLEIVSTGLAEHFPDDDERPPLPRYIPYGETHQESLFHPRAKKYPLLLVSNHPRWRFHAQGDDVTWLREIPTCKVRGPDGYFYEPLWIHPSDAEKRGVRSGDIVKVFNERGIVLCGAYVTERIAPGSVLVHHGARADIISINPLIDRGGAINLIVPSKPASKNTVGMVCSGILVEVEKVDLAELMKRYPQAFSRPTHPDVGPYYDTWVIG